MEINKVIEGYERYKIYMYNNCGILIKLPDEVIKNHGIKGIYIKEQFIKSVKFFKKFLGELEIVGKIYNWRNVNIGYSSDIYTAKGKNNIKMIYEYDDGDRDYTFYTYSACKITRYLVDKVFNYRTIHKKDRVDYSKIFPDTFLEFYFETCIKNSWINDDNIILYPNYKNTYFNKQYIDDTKNSTKDITLSDIYFEGLIKCDNYNELMMKYEDGDYDVIREELIKCEYRSVMYLTKDNIKKMKNVYNSIINFFGEKYGVLEDNILIDLPIFNILNKRWLWIYINVSIRDIYKGNYSIRTKAQSIGVIKMYELIKYMKKSSEHEIYHVLDGLHSLYATLKMIEEIDIDDQCLNSVKYNVFPRTINYVPKYENSVEERVDYDDIIQNNKFNVNIKVYNVTIGSNFISSSKCGVNICCEINGKHCIVIIYPLSFKFFYNMKEDIIKYIKNNLVDGTNFEYNYDNDNYAIVSGYLNNLQYSVQIIKIGNYKCNSCNDRISNDMFMDELILYNKKQTIIKFCSNMKIANYILDYCKNNFQVTFHIIVYNLIRNIIVCYKKNGSKHINKYIGIIDRILIIEEKYNNARNIKDYYLRNLVGDYKCEEFYNNDGDIIIDEHYNINCNYICVLGKEYIDSRNKYEFKYLIWYTAHNIEEYDDINKVVSNIENVFNNIFEKDLHKNRRGVFDIPFDKNDISYIYGLGTGETNKYVNKYVYNIASLVDEIGQYKSLDKFIKFLEMHLTKRSLLYRSYTYHYVTNYVFQTLHIHISLKATLKISRTGTMSGIINMGRSGNMKHEHSHSLMKDYYKFRPEIWKKYHSMYIVIKCNGEFVKYIKEKKNEIDDLYYQLIEKNNKNYDKLMLLIYYFMDKKQFADVFIGFNEDFIKKCMKRIIKHGDNYNTTLKMFYNFTKYIGYYELYEK